MVKRLERFISERAFRTPLSGIKKFSEKALALGDVIRLELGEPDFDTPTYIKEAAKEAMEKGYTHYTAIAGIPELREAIAEKLREENGIEADPENEILVTCGGYHAVFAVFNILLNPGDEVILTDPSWSAYYSVAKFVGAKVVYCPLYEDRGFKPDIGELENKISDRTKLVVLNTPQNPTGAVLDRKILEEIADIIQKKDVILLSDEVYEKIIFDGEKHFSIASIPDVRDRVITVFSFSKTYAMTGWRVGYVVANPIFTAHMRKMISISTVCASSIAQYAALTALKGPQDAVVEMVKEYEHRRNLIVSELNKIDGVKCFKPRGAFYVFPDFSEISKDSMSLAMHILEKARVVTVPGVIFGPEIGEGHLRLSFATSRENLEKAVRRIREVISNL